MEAFKTRLIEELLDVRSRLTLLHNFIFGRNETYKHLALKVKFYLRAQYVGMYIYHKYLVKRMEYLDITPDHIDAYYSEEAARAYLHKAEEVKLKKECNGRKDKKSTK